MSKSPLPELLRAAERRVNAHCWPNTAENIGADSHLVSIPASPDTDTDLLLTRAADEINRLWDVAEKRYWSIQRLEGEVEHLESLIKQWQGNCTGMHGSQNPCGMSANFTVDPLPGETKAATSRDARSTEDAGRPAPYQMTEAERDAMQRALDRSMTVIDPGFESDAAVKS